MLSGHCTVEHLVNCHHLQAALNMTIGVPYNSKYDVGCPPPRPFHHENGDC
jgi:hypothetical protein